MSEIKPGQRNLSKQHELIEFLGDKNQFSPKGIQFLAKRSLGTQYKKLLEMTLTAYRDGTLQKIIPNDVKLKIQKAFSFPKDIPDPALVIISTGRRAVHGAKGWDEGGVSLLTTPNLPNNFDKEDAKTKERITKMLEMRLTQKVVVEELMEVLLAQVPKDPVIEPEVKVVPKPTETSKVLEFKTVKKPETKVKEPAVKEPVVKKTPLKRNMKKSPKTDTEI